MYEFYLNNEKVIYDKDIYLIDYIRDVKHITSVKKGCGDVSCGSCMVLVDSKATKSCHIKLSQIQNKNITTVEGISEREKQVYTYAFKKVGAVQCGYCTPAMVISTKSLIDEIGMPTKSQIKKAISKNICRCTGYVKIQEAIELSAKILNDDIQIQQVKSKTKIADIIDEKILGKAIYTGDIYDDDMIYASALRLDIPRVFVKNIDYTAALKHKDVVAIIDKSNLKKGKYIGINKDVPVFVGVGEETRCISDAICVVGSKNRDTLDEIKSLIKVEYEELKPITTISESIKKSKYNIDGVSNILKKIEFKREDADKSIKNSKYVVTNDYTFASTDHGFLETESAFAYVKDNQLNLYVSMSNLQSVKKQLEDILDVEKINIISTNVGGDFGGKIDITLAHHCSLMALVTGKKVKMSFSRKESIKYHNKRAPMQIKITTACDENGKFTAIKSIILADTGAYSTNGENMIQRACIHMGGPYNYANVDIKGVALYTNNITSSTYRGNCVEQVNFALESNINELAQLVGISPWDIRYKNAVEFGDILPNGQIVDSDVALKETLLSVKDYFFSNDYVGVACGMSSVGNGVGNIDTGKCVLVVKNENIIINSDVSLAGQGMDVALIQVVCEIVGVSPDMVSFEKVEFDDTNSSKHTFFILEALRRAAMKLKSALENENLKKMNGRYFVGQYMSITDPINSQKENPVSHVSYAYATHCVSLDEYGKVKKVLASHDVGKAINPNSIQGQIHGGVAMSLGYALTEKINSKKGVISGDFSSLKILNAVDMPPIESIIVEKNISKLAYGAKSVAEISAIPTPAALQGAYIKYDGIFRTNIPLEETVYNKKKAKKVRINSFKTKI